MSDDPIHVGDTVRNPEWPDRPMTVLQLLPREGIAQVTYTEAGKVRKALHGITSLERIES